MAIAVTSVSVTCAIFWAYLHYQLNYLELLMYSV